MKIGIDGRLLRKRRGIGNYVHHLLSAFAHSSCRHEFVVYGDHPAIAELIPDDSRFTYRQLGVRGYAAWEQLSLPRAAAGDALDILHCPANTGPLWLSRKVSLVLSVMDVMYLLPAGAVPFDTSLYQRLGRAYRQLVVPRTASNAKRIVTISKASATDIRRLLRVPDDRIVVTYLAPGSEFSARTASTCTSAAAEPTEEAVFVALGALDPRKNTVRVINAFAQLRRRLRRRCRLVIAGLNEGGMERFGQLVSMLGLESEVELMSFVPDSELVALYRKAIALVYPSLYEGFGLPIVEAMSCGAAVVTSKCGSIPEVAGDAAVFVDPLSETDIASGMLRLCNDEVFRRRLVESGKKNAARFTWDSTARATLDVYEAARHLRQL